MRDLVLVTNDMPSTLPQRSGRFHAMVRAGNSVTAYFRSGQGKPLLMLHAPDSASALWELLLDKLSTGFRVLVPELAPDADSLDDWFGAFHDGLGIGAVSLVVDDRYAAPALRLALTHGSRIERVVFVTAAGTPADVIGALQDEWSGEAHPVLVVTGVDGAEEASARISAFLARP